MFLQSNSACPALPPVNVSCLGGESSIAPPFITTLPHYNYHTSQPHRLDLILMARSDTTLLTRDTVKLPEQRRRDT